MDGSKCTAHERAAVLSSRFTVKLSLSIRGKNDYNRVDYYRALARNTTEKIMKKVICQTAILLLLPLGAVAFGQDMGKLVEAVDQDKAVESVDTDQMKEAVSSGDVDYKKAYDSVDKEKAADSVDMEKVKEAVALPE